MEGRRAWIAGSCALAALLAALTSWYRLRHGLVISPDGWFTWQASVSLLHGQGLVDFWGHPIVNWAPLYTVYLAAWQAALGVSGQTLILANVFLAAVAAWGWTWLLAGRLAERRSLALVIAGYVAAVVVVADGALLAHNLFYALLPLVFLAARAPGRPLLLGLALTGLLLGHNSGVVLLPPVALLLWRRPGRWRSLALGVAMPAAIWLLVRLFLGQIHSHTLGGRAAPPRVIWQAVDAVGWSLGGQVGLVVLAILALHLWRTRRDPLWPGSDLVMAGGATLGLVVVFSLTDIYDPLGSRAPIFGLRFLLFWPLLLWGHSLVLVRQLRQPLTILAVLALLPPAWVAGQALARLEPPADCLSDQSVCPRNRISPEHVEQPPREDDEGWMLRSPPRYR